jgi:alkanesulfonate monooxygenase SsuD/methylene tetrahydromethanopterin reductase-like flavin-dependent oxidoreductase (luciferase family)
MADRDFWHCLYLADHFMPDGEHTPVAADGSFYMLEATAVLAAIAGATSRIRLSNLVLSATFRHPAVLANWAATVDHISRGRLTLGIGSGWQPNEHRQYGLTLGSPGEQVDRLREVLTVLTGLLSDPTTTFAGNYYQISDAVCDPKPVQSPLPLLVSGRRPRMMRLVARFAQLWNHWSTPDSFPRATLALDAACEQVGRDPASVWRTTQAFVFITDSPESEDRAAAIARRTRLPVIYGGPARIVEAVGQWRDAGADELIIPNRTMLKGAARHDAYSRLAELLTPFSG